MLNNSKQKKNTNNPNSQNNKKKINFNTIIKPPEKLLKIFPPCKSTTGIVGVKVLHFFTCFVQSNFVRRIFFGRSQSLFKVVVHFLYISLKKFFNIKYMVLLTLCLSQYWVFSIDKGVPQHLPSTTFMYAQIVYLLIINKKKFFFEQKTYGILN